MCQKSYLGLKIENGKKRKGTVDYSNPYVVDTRELITREYACVEVHNVDDVMVVRIMKETGSNLRVLDVKALSTLSTSISSSVHTSTAPCKGCIYYLLACRWYITYWIRLSLTYICEVSIVLVYALRDLAVCFPPLCHLLS